MPTLAQFRTRIATQAGLDNTVGGQQGLIDNWIDDARQELTLETRPRVRRATMSLTAGLTDYQLATGALAIKTITYNPATGSGHTLDRLTPSEIEDMRTREVEASDGSVRYYAHAGTDMLIVYPEPATGDSLTVLYVPSVVILDTALPTTSTPGELFEGYQKAIELYALREAHLWRDGSQDMAKAQLYNNLFEAQKVKIRKWQSRMGGQKTRATIGAGRRYVPSDPSSTLNDW